jgi:hypothetical protein
MAHGSDYVLTKGFKVLATYNSSAVAGVTKFRGVKFATGDTIDLNVAATTLGVGIVQEDIDATKVATGKAVAAVAMMGTSKLVVQTAASIVQGSRVTLGNAGGAVIAASTNQQIGICMTTGTIAAGDLIDVFLTIGQIAP